MDGLMLPLPRKFEYGPSRLEPVIQRIYFRMLCTQREAWLGLYRPSGEEVLAEAKAIAKEVMTAEEYFTTMDELGIE